VIETQQIVCLNIDCNPDGKNQYSFDNGYETIFVESDKFENDIMCTDEDGNIWSCDFDRESGYKKWIYLPSEFHLM
jgi:sugar lactone lactonase YvrE